MGNVILSTVMPHETGKQHVVKIALSVELVFRRRCNGTGEKNPLALRQRVNPIQGELEETDDILSIKNLYRQFIVEMSDIHWCDSVDATMASSG